jgi:hypothetical protein
MLQEREQLEKWVNENPDCKIHVGLAPFDYNDGVESGDADLIFFDPDNGLNVKSVKYGNRRSSKYLYRHEVEQFFKLGNSLLIYQHFPHVKREPFIAGLAGELMSLVSTTVVMTFQTSNVVFFLLSQPRHREHLDSTIAQLTGSWGSQIRINRHNVRSTEDAQALEEVAAESKIEMQDDVAIDRQVPSKGTESEEPRGSLKWIRKLVNERPELIDSQLRAALLRPPDTRIEWVSPLESDEYSEYCDGVFLKKLGVRPRIQSLSAFWPKGGPHWDGLARTNDGGVILVEAKANVDEILTTPSGASPESLKKIRRSLKETQRFLGAKPGCDWTKRFYQYANRLAFLYFLREVNGIDAYLVFLYFLNDPDTNGPKTEREWRAAIKVLHEALGIRKKLPKRYVVDVFVDVREL